MERFLSTDEFARLGAAFAATEKGQLMINGDNPKALSTKKKRGGQKRNGPRSEKPSVIAAIRLLLFTGCRVGEILSLQWSHIHLDRRLLLLPDSKTGAKAVNICTAAKIHNLRLHDLRHSFASIGAADGVSLQKIGALLGHTQPTTTARYAHLAASPLHDAVEAIGAKIAAAMTLR